MGSNSNGAALVTDSDRQTKANYQKHTHTIIFSVIVNMTEKATESSHLKEDCFTVIAQPQL